MAGRGGPRPGAPCMQHPLPCSVTYWRHVVVGHRLVVRHLLAGVYELQVLPLLDARRVADVLGLVGPRNAALEQRLLHLH